MRTIALLAPFIGALIINRESAAIYASGASMPVYLQLAGALLWYAFLVAGIWIVGRQLGQWLPGKLLIIGYLCDMARRFEQKIKHSDSGKPTDLSRFVDMSRYKLLPMLLGYSLAPSGFWVNVEILRRRRCNTAVAVAWLAPCNAVSYKVYFAGMSILAMVGMDVVFAFLSEKIILPLIIVAIVVLAIDLLWYVVRRFDDWCRIIYVRLPVLAR